MNRIEKIQAIRGCLREGKASIGSWIQIPHPSIAEIMGDAGYDWVAVDMEHGSISVHQLPDLFRALELGGTLPLVRLAQGHGKDCKAALDAGAGGVIVPMVASAQQLMAVREACCWPPAGARGVGVSRANLFGKRFDAYREEAQAPLLVAMIEHIDALNNLEAIVRVPGLDALFIGPYDLSASMGFTGQFDRPDLESAIVHIRNVAEQHRVPCGLHVVEASPALLRRRLDEGYRFIAYSIDSVILNHAAERPAMNAKP